MKKYTKRDIHRIFAFFYVGLIISFAISGILNNHRDQWDIPMNYTYETKELKIDQPFNKDDYNSKAKIAEKAKKWYPNSEYRGSRVRHNKLRAFYKDNTIIDLDLDFGFGEIEYRRKTPVIGHMLFLHKFTNEFWIIYSDIFAISLIVIAITGLMLPRGKNSFKKTGWKITLLGLLIPTLVLILFG